MQLDRHIHVYLYVYKIYRGRKFVSQYIWYMPTLGAKDNENIWSVKQN